jgi:catechol-2,3-dioxygenase
MADFDQQTSKVLAPSALAHVVLQTANLDRMIDFYTNFLGGTVTHRNEMLAFITYDNEHHRIALIGLPSTSPKVVGSCGLDHVSFAFPDLTSLLLAYRQRKARMIEPFWSVNHGPTTSIYYKDPDGNKLETQVDNFDTNEATTKFMESATFAENPIGADFDPEELIERIKAGEDVAELKKRIEIGPRGIPAGF